MQSILIITQVLIGIAMIAIILVQRGTGAAAGSGFGGGASGTVFGSTGSGSFLTRATAVLATAFFLISMSMAVIAGRSAQTAAEVDLGVMNQAEVADDVPEVETAISNDDVPVITTDAGSVADDVPQIEVQAGDPAVSDDVPVVTDDADSGQAADEQQDAAASESETDDNQ